MSSKQLPHLFLAVVQHRSPSIYVPAEAAFAPVDGVRFQLVVLAAVTRLGTALASDEQGVSPEKALLIGDGPAGLRRSWPPSYTSVLPGWRFAEETGDGWLVMSDWYHDPSR